MVRSSPWLMLSKHHTSKELEREQIKQTTFLNVHTKQVHTFELPKNTCGESKTICRFSHDWLIVFDESSSILTLINPFSGHQIVHLPRLPLKGTVHKVTLSGDPYSDELSILAIFGDKRELIGYQENTNRWTVLQDKGYYFDDILDARDQAFVAASELGKLVIYKPPVCKEIVAAADFHGKKVYLVSIDGWLYMLVSFSGPGYYFWSQTYNDELRRFKIYMYNEGKWHLTRNLMEHTIFMGHEHLIAVRDAVGFRPNCVYYIDDDEGNVDNSGVFSLEDHKAERVQWFMSDAYTKRGGERKALETVVLIS